MKKEKLSKCSTIVLRVAVTLVFLLAGSGKFQTESIIATNFKNWNLGPSVMYMVGFTEIIGVLFLFSQKTISYGFYLLIAVMAGAIIIHFINFESLGFPILKVILIILLLTILNLNKVVRHPKQLHYEK